MLDKVQIGLHYYPFGMAMPSRNLEGDYRYAYQGQEKDPETGKEAFELRLWDSRIGRWLTTDPYNQYDSPYMAMDNNPISSIDPDGGCTDCLECPDACGQLDITRIFPGNSIDIDSGSFFLRGDTKTSFFGDEVTIIGTKPFSKKVLSFTSDFIAPFVEVPQEFLFPIINQTNVLIKEGAHSGQANNFDNIIFPNTFQFEDFSFVRGSSTSETGRPTFEEGKEKINNTIDVIPLPISIGKKAVNFTTETVIKEVVKSSINNVHN